MTEYLAPGLFLILWVVHSWLVERSRWRTHALSWHMEEERRKWMQTMARRELRMIDTNIISGLQSGTAFFASTSLLAIGAAFTLLNNTDSFLGIAQSLPALVRTSDPTAFQIKAIGLMLLYAYAFLKFGWAYRLFNYASILVGMVPMPKEEDREEEVESCVEKATAMCVEAGREFNRGQRAFFIAIGYLGWFFGDIFFVFSTLAVYTIMVTRQFFSPAHHAVD